MEYKEHRRLGDVYELLDREFYDFYREHRKYKSKGIDQYNYFVKCVNGIFETIYSTLKETDGGVYIYNFGYFHFIKSRKKRRKKKETNILKKYKKEYYYRLWFTPDKGLTDWYLYSKMKLPNYKPFVAYDLIEAYYQLKKSTILRIR